MPDQPSSTCCQVQELLGELERSLQDVLKTPGEEGPAAEQAAANMNSLLAMLDALPKPVPAELAQAVGRIGRLHSQVILALAQRRQELLGQIARNRAGRQGLQAYSQ